MDTPTVGESYSLKCTVFVANISGYVASYLIQWRKDGNALAGETAALLSFSPFRPSHGGRYTCEVTVGNAMFNEHRELIIACKMSIVTIAIND